ncbi:hypothetical protein J1C56_08800 [Aminobacter anthyllidis]|uniref:Uncharacterized protein n=1 Tax=Aminobacter anthyllidis TaxID=1035067 RepID=A0A9X1A9K6_9HYPH|nr:hypothetical protein [Aminobacter anthyllidis]MBT1155690.1 hypothetical protein [Aminobacter anthyllidis]
MTDDRLTDWALILHERQSPQDDPNHHDDESDSVVDCDGSKAKQRQHKTALRSGQGDRTDWKQHLYGLPGQRLIPDALLSIRTKQARTASLKAAALRRTKRRDDSGIPIHYSRLAWRRLPQAKRDQFNQSRKALAWIGPRWDVDRDFSWYHTGDDGGEHLDQLFRFGAAQAQPKQSFQDHCKQAHGQRPAGWYVTK